MHVPKILFVVGLLMFVSGIVLFFAFPTMVIWNPKSETLATEKTLAVSAAWQSKSEVLAENEYLSTSPKWQSQKDELVDEVFTVPTWRTYDYDYDSASTPYYVEVKGFVISGNATERSSPPTSFNFYIFDSVDFDLWTTDKTYNAYYEEKGKTSLSFNFSIAEVDASDWFYFVVEENVSDMKPTVSVMATASWIEESYSSDYTDYQSYFGLSSFEEIKNIVVEGTATEVEGNEFNFYIMDYSNYYDFMDDEAYIALYEAETSSTIEFSVPLTETQATSSIYFVLENPNLDIEETANFSAVMHWLEKSSTNYCSECFTHQGSTYEEKKDFTLKGTATEENNKEFNLYIFDEIDYYSWETSESYSFYHQARNVTTTSFIIPLTEEEAESEIYVVAENPLTGVNENVKISATLEWKEKATTAGISSFVSVIGLGVMVVSGIAALIYRPSTPKKTYHPQMETKTTLSVPLQNNCTNCNAILELDDKFCPECGIPIRKQPNKAGTSRGRNVLAEIASLLIGGIVYLYLRSYIGFIAMFAAGVSYMVLRPLFHALLGVSDDTERSSKQDEEGHNNSATQ